MSGTANLAAKDAGVDCRPRLFDRHGLKLVQNCFFVWGHAVSIPLLCFGKKAA